MAPMMQSKRLFDSCWPDTYRSLRRLCSDAATKPDFIVADFFADAAARDMLRQFDVPLASVWPQMPYGMAPASYVPGQPGFQLGRRSLTSEHASLADRFASEMVVVRSLPELFRWFRWTRCMRADAGVNYLLSPATKPDYLVLVNSFFGLETPKDLPPLIVPVGPILSDSYQPLDETLLAFLDRHDRTLYASLGTHVCLPTEELEKLLAGFIQALDAGYINGIIWSVPQRPRANFHVDKVFSRANGSILAVSSILDGSHPDIHIPTFVPQRAVLAHPSTRLFLTHGGGSSANETLFHGVPVLVIGYFFDQLCNSIRLQDAGVGLSLDKDRVTSDGISDTIGTIMDDADGSIARNVCRMKRIARVASRRKHHAADLIEEVMYDHELRLRDGVVVRPMHLQTADMRMPLWKARNWDMWFVSLTSITVGGVIVWRACKSSWRRLPRILDFSIDLVKRLAGT